MICWRVGDKYNFIAKRKFKCSSRPEMHELFEILALGLSDPDPGYLL
jgi:hypothetical protein